MPAPTGRAAERDGRTHLRRPDRRARMALRGEVRLKSFTADPMAIQDYAPLENEDGTRVS